MPPKKIFYLLIIMALAIAIRVSRFLPNVSPVAAVAIWAGANFRHRSIFLAPLLVMFIADSFIGFYHWPIMLSVYGSFGLMVFLSRSVLAKPKPLRVIRVSLYSSTLFYLLTNFSVWWFSGMYPRTLDGLIQCYYYAIPFYRNTLLGDMAYSGVIFLAWQYSPFFLKLLARSAKLIRIKHPSFHVDA